MYKQTAKDIVYMLNKNVEGVVKHLLPNGKRKNNEWYAGSVNGDPGESLRVCLYGERLGAWCDFANNIYRGDLLNLWSDCRNLSLHDAILEAKQWLGISEPKFEPQRRLNSIKPTVNFNSPLAIGSSVVNYLVSERKLTIETLKVFRIAADGDRIAFPYYRDNDLIMVKYLDLYRSNGKKEIHVSPKCDHILFGWQAACKGARIIAITEGEIDAMSLYQYNLPFDILSIPFGGGIGNKHKWIENEFERIAIYDEIYLCLDNDQTGEDTKQELISLLGRHRCRLVTLPLKDANECLQQEISEEEIKKCFDFAVVLDPIELKRADSFVEQVVQELYPTDDCHPGYKLPWNCTQGKVLLAPDELSIWTGINGHGKSQVLGQVILGCMQQGARVCIASLELKPKRLLARLTRQAAGLRKPSEGYIRAIHEWYSNQLWLFDLVGTAKAERLIEVFQYARQRYCIDVFVIDSFMKCGIAEDDFNSQKQFVERLCDFKNEHECHIHLVVHPRKLEDELKRPGKLDVKGSGAITDLTDNCFSVWRNKKKEETIRKVPLGAIAPKDLLDSPDALLACEKQRNGEWEGNVALWFDADSFQYLDSYGHKPKQMVEWSA